MRGKIIQIKSDGYERCINIECYDPRVGTIWCYFLDKEYLEPGQEMKSMLNGVEVDFDVSVVFVNKYEVLDDSAPLKMRQSIEQSSHVQVIALVVRIIDEWTMVCNIDVLKNVVVEFETKLSGVNVGQKLSFEGELQMVIQE